MVDSPVRRNDGVFKAGQKYAGPQGNAMDQKLLQIVGISVVLDSFGTVCVGVYWYVSI